MPDSAPLAGVRVLVTRPAHQAEPLARLIEQAGGSVFRFPTITIAPPRDIAALQAALDRLETFQLAIFISPNAVEQTFAALRQRRQALPPALSIACVGAGSAQALAGHDVHQVILPTLRYDSEGLLAHPRLAQVAGRRIVIFRGDGGKELLGRTLIERGADVTYAECYQRLRPKVDPAPLQDRLRRHTIDIVSVTSADGLRHLYAIAGDAGAELLTLPVVVVSQAQSAVCRELGFAAEPIIATAPSDAAILDAIKAWRRP